MEGRKGEGGRREGKEGGKQGRKERRKIALHGLQRTKESKNEASKEWNEQIVKFQLRHQQIPFGVPQSVANAPFMLFISIQICTLANTLLYLLCIYIYSIYIYIYVCLCFYLRIYHHFIWADRPSHGVCDAGGRSTQPCTWCCRVGQYVTGMVVDRPEFANRFCNQFRSVHLLHFSFFCVLFVATSHDATSREQWGDCSEPKMYWKQNALDAFGAPLEETPLIWKFYVLVPPLQPSETF